MRPRRHRSTTAVVAVVTLVTGWLVVVDAAATVSARAPVAKPEHGGSLRFALEAETDTTNGFCLPAAQLAASGIQVVSAVYDTLVTRNSTGEYVPYLARSVVPDADFTHWTITVRAGVKFHDGTPLDARAVKLNLDTYRGKNPAINVVLNAYVFADIASVEVTGPLTVVVTTKRPWRAFPAFLFGTGRYGMVAPAQLASQAECATSLIGTGPFEFVRWIPGESLTVERNPSYWQRGLPYLDEIEFVPLPDAQQRTTGLLSDDFDLVQMSSAIQILALDKRAQRGEVQLRTSDHGAEVAYGLLNVSKPPFDDILARKAVAYAGDARELNDVINKGVYTLASGPFAPDSPAYLEDTGLPRHDLAEAKRLAAEYERKHGEPIRFEYLTVTDPEAVRLGALVKEQQARAGIEVTIQPVAQALLISRAVSGSFQQIGFRNHPGGDPDTQYVWWHSASVVNFGRIDDPMIDDLLDRGRVETDPDERVEIYRALNRRFAKQLYDLWVWYTLWANGAATDVRGVAGPPLPDGHGRPSALFAGVIPVVGLWRTGSDG